MRFLGQAVLYRAGPVRDLPGSQSGTTTYQLCDFEQVT